MCFRNDLLLKCARVAVLCLFAAGPIAEAAEPTKILFLAGPRSHASGDHEFNAGCLLLAKALNEQSGLDVEATVIKGWPEDESVFDGVDAVIIYSDSTKVVGKGWEKTNELAAEGVGLMFMHYAVHPNKEQGEKYFQPWIGGAFETGYSVNPHWVADLKTLPDHPISNGVTNLVRAYDEFYYSMRFREDRGEVLDLVTAVPTKERLKRIINLWNENGINGLNKPQTLMWGVEREDGGRGVGFTGGHYHRNWAIDGFRKIALNAIVWVAGMEVPEGGVKSKPVTEDEINENLDDYGKPNPRIKLPNVEEQMALPPAPFVGVEELKKREEEKKKRDAQRKKKARQAAAPAGKPGEIKDAIYESPVLRSGAKERVAKFDVKLDGSKDLFLVVSDEGDRSHDWANWIDTKVRFEDGSEISLTKLDWASARSLGETRKSKNYGNGDLKVAGKVFEDGIGTHAPSVIHFQLPKPAAGIQGMVALDDGGAIRGGKSTPAEVRFRIFTKTPPAVASTSNKTSNFDPESLEPQLVPAEKLIVPDDLEVTVWATSPMLFNPTNMDSDAQGRIWVTEGVNYRRNKGRRPEGDRVIVLEDTDQDGKADKEHTFVQDPELEAPLGIAVMDNKILVSQPPSLIVYTDVDRNLRFDPKVDKREELLTGFNGRQHDHSLHAVTAGPDGKWYINQGNCGAKFTDGDGRTFSIGGPYQGGGGTFYHNNYDLGGVRSDDGRIWTGGFAARMNRDATGLTIIGHGFRNSYEHTVTSLGDVFQNDNDDPPACRVSWMMEGAFFGFFSRDGKRTWQADQRPGQSVPEAHWRQDSPGTTPPGDVYGSGSPTGVAYYENGALPEKYNGLLLSCEARGQVIFGYHPAPEGSGFSLERFDFLKASSGTLFRPSDVLVGADGALYVSDWFDPGVGGHADRDKSTSGTIYRVAPKGFRPPKSYATDPVSLLSSPSPNVRDAGWVALREKGADMIPDLEPLLEHENRYLQARAIWLLPFAGEAGVERVLKMLESEEEADRLLAFRVLRNAEYAFSEKERNQLANDLSESVRRELAVSLRYEEPEKKVSLVVTLLKQLPEGDRFYLEACGMAAEGAEEAVWAELEKVGGAKEAGDWADAFAWVTWRLQPKAAIPALVERANDDSLTNEQQKLALDTLAYTRQMGAAEAMADLAEGGNEEARRWLLARAWGEWEEFGAKEKLKELGIYDPENVVVQAAAMPRYNKPSSLPPMKEILSLKGDPKNGQLLSARCYACHQIEGNGIAYGPDLRSWVSNQGMEAFLRAVIDPSAEIAHGFNGTSVKLKGDAGYIHGLAISRQDPVIIQSMGGLTQIIPKSKTEKVSNYRSSLMLSADQLGLTAQDLADLGAYLETVK